MKSQPCSSSSSSGPETPRQRPQAPLAFGAHSSLLAPIQDSIRKISSSGRFTIIEASGPSSSSEDRTTEAVGATKVGRALKPADQDENSAQISTGPDSADTFYATAVGCSVAVAGFSVTDVESPAGSCRRCVHFEVDSPDQCSDPTDCVYAEEEEHLTRDHTVQATTKSWRHVQTLERPPIMDFYRNSIRGVSRPTMSELLNSGTNRTPCAEFETFKEEHENLVESQMAAADGRVAADGGAVSTGERSDRRGKCTGDGATKPSSLSQHDVKFEASSDSNYTVEGTSRPGGSATKSAGSGTSNSSTAKLGWVEGVFFRCILNIFGVMLYLRISWVAGQAGIALGALVVLFSSLVTMITALSTCAICTNGDVKGGGAYFLISRSLGPEFGGSIGLIFSVANAVGAAMYIVGFAETVSDLLRGHSIEILDGGLNDVRIIGLVTCVVLISIVFIGTSFESKMQMGLLAILILSILDYIAGTFAPVTEEQRRRGLTGYSVATFKENLLPSFRDGYDFFTVFSIYFPAATGIMAGANISGDLANPQRAIPLGTVLAIAVTTGIYLLSVVLIGSTCVRDADGVHFPELISSQELKSAKMVPGDGWWTLRSYTPPTCAINNTCPYGLLNNFQVMELESLWGPLITAGIFAATLSSALASLVSAPKIFQAVCKDRIFPYIGHFGRGFGKRDEPRRAYLLGFVISMLMILIGDLNAIAPIISNFFLCSYALINYACFDNSFAHSPGFRPSFRYYNMWISLIGAVLCVTVMFIVSWSTALLTFFFFGLLFMYLRHRKPDVNWGSSTQAHSYRSALQSVIRLERTDDHVKTYRPQLLVLTGNPILRPQLVDFGHSLTRGTSLMICGCVIPYAASDSVFAMSLRLREQIRAWLQRRRVKSFFACVGEPSLRAGAQAMLQLCGLGRLRPNILMMGFKHDWNSKAPGLGSIPSADAGESDETFQKSIAEISDYFGIIQDAFDNDMGVVILRNSDANGLDMTETLRLINTKILVGHNNNENNSDKKTSGTAMDSVSTEPKVLSESESLLREVENYSSTSSAEGGDESYGRQDGAEDIVEFVEKYPQPELSTRTVDGPEDGRHAPVQGTDGEDEKMGRRSLIATRRSSRTRTTIQRSLLNSMNRFQRRVKNAIIDVWWLYDDGGLTLLLPHLLTQPKSYLENASMRVFTIAKSATSLEAEQRSMAALLNKFRIEFSDLHVIADAAKKPQRDVIEEFERLIAPFRIAGDESGDDGAATPARALITDGEWRAQNEKIMRQLRITELLRQHSAHADLIVLSMPVPRRGLISACMYMAWLDAMTRGLPPTLLVRGNQHSVLTFYS